MAVSCIGSNISNINAFCKDILIFLLLHGCKAHNREKRNKKECPKEQRAQKLLVFLICKILTFLNSIMLRADRPLEIFQNVVGQGKHPTDLFLISLFSVVGLASVQQHKNQYIFTKCFYIRNVTSDATHCPPPYFSRVSECHFLVSNSFFSIHSSHHFMFRAKYCENGFDPLFTAQNL